MYKLNRIKVKTIRVFVGMLLITTFIFACNKKQSINRVREFNEPIVTKDAKMPSGDKSTWQCVYFGTFPQLEILRTNDELPIDDYAVNDDVIRDDELYKKLEDKASSLKDKEENGIIEIELDGKKYRAEKNKYLNVPDRKQYYKYNSNAAAYHFFKYTPIKWRVIHVENNILTLISDKLLVSMQPNERSEKTYWADSRVRNYLNAMKNNQDDYSSLGFFNVAFDEKEKSAILKTKVENKKNTFYGTNCGEDTEDYVFIPSDDEVFSTIEAAEDGFYYGSGVDDAAKRFRSTIYAKFMGAWWSPVESYKGNSFWMMRTNGYSANTVSYICDFGYIYNRGMVVNTDGAGVLPMIRVDYTKADLIDAGEVSSDEINKNTYKFKNVDEKKPDDNDEKATPKPVNEKRDYEIITFGTYPQREVINSKIKSSKDFNLVEEDYILDEELYNKLEKQASDSKANGNAKAASELNEIVEIDQEKYLLICDRNTKYKDDTSHYSYHSDYYYFKIEPINWRVLEDANGKKTLISDKVLDCTHFYNGSGECVWEESDILKWLNADDNKNPSFYARAFSEEEKKKIVGKKITKDDIKDNYYFGTSCKTENDSKKKYTDDVKVYILSEEELFYGDKAKIYGFNESDGVPDVNRRFKSTAFAKYKGVWFSNKDDDKFGNAFYMTRTNGYDRSTIVYVGEEGSIFNRGIGFDIDDIGLLPVIEIQ